MQWSGLTDTHAHLSHLAQRGVGAAWLDGLFADGFGRILDIGNAPGDIAGRLALLKAYPNVRFACGIWPSAAQAAVREQAVLQLEAEIDAAPQGLVVAIGECGFDRLENPQPTAAERELLELQLDLARRRKLPVVIHSREALEDTLETLGRYPDVRGVIHCFSYDRTWARAFLDLDYFISFAGNLTYKNAHTLRETLPFVPRERLLLETDCPYLAPVPHRGKVCSSDMIIETYKLAAELCGCTLDAMKERIAVNADALFRGAVAANIE